MLFYCSEIDRLTCKQRGSSVRLTQDDVSKAIRLVSGLWLD